MSETKDGGPAFPRDHRHDGHNGMSLRDYFAGQFMRSHMQLNDHNCNEYQAKYAARWSYRVADAMLAARTEGGADNG